jgi:RNA-directed DNA polymerase
LAKPPLEAPHALARDIATLLLAQHHARRSLSPTALSKRAAVHFTHLASLVRTVRYALVAVELAWPKWSVATLARWIEANVPAFQYCVTQQETVRVTIADVLSGMFDSIDYDYDDEEEYDPDLDAQQRAARAAWLSQSLITPLRPFPMGAQAATAFQTQMRTALPALETPEDLLRVLEISAEEFAAVMNQRGAPRIPYRPVLREKANGSLRLIEQPSAALRGLQRKLLFQLLNRVPVHPAAYGFVRGKSVADHARLHTGKAMVIRVDIKDFFPSISPGRVYATFHGLGIAPAVARTRCQLTTSALSSEQLRSALFTRFPGAPSRVNEYFQTWKSVFGVPHLPQGAPTSPALANLAAFRLDQRLTGFAARYDLAYSRYADDLTFSGNISISAAQKWLDSVRFIVADDGWAVNERKTRIMPCGGRQRVTGVVVNEFANIARKDFDLLKAQVHRYSQLPTRDAAQRAQLLGQLAWLGQFHPARAEKLRAQLNLNLHA